ncbi:D-aminoacyl-tRNA deacylase [Halalkalibacillus halophilus]|uniref:D-aminoacyl-tRNA deacylase n=1 Tax=Halalkalibacillus halophilus TaxID=392827 RepID=UPI00040432B0|nr:D-aminoacyl-tRNA deacylase [Halalkalibacillus halophilus]
MRAIVQRASNGEVKVNNKSTGAIDVGLVVLLGVTHEDTIEDAKYLADKIANLRIFEDDEGKMNLSVKEIGGKVLSISQFTLYGDTKKGRRPNFMQAAKPPVAEELYESFNQCILDQDLGLETGAFGQYMEVSLTNDGPVTLIIDSNDKK